MAAFDTALSESPRKVADDSEWADVGRRKRLADRVAALGNTEHEQILRILHSNGMRYTQNNNGVFCDITRAPTAVLESIENFIEYSSKSAHVLDEERRATALPPQKPKDKKERSAPQYRVDRVKAFANSLAKTKSESSAQKRKEACRYQQLRKKYLREVSSKTSFSNELLPE